MSLPTPTAEAGSPNPSEGPVATASAGQGSPMPGTGTLTLTVHTLPSDWSVKSGPFVASDGTEVVWASTNARDASGQPYVADLVGFVPGRDAAPHVIYRHADRDSLLWWTGVAHGHYAFLEQNTRLLGEDGWRLWAVPAEGAKPVLLDRSAERTGAPAAMFALSADRVFWTSFHVRNGAEYSELRSVRYDGTDSRVLLSSPGKDRQYWYPSIDTANSRLLFATVEPSGSSWHFRVFALDLAHAAAIPVRLGDSDDVTEPLSNGSAVVWRGVDGNVANWGADLAVAEPGGQAAVPLSVAMPAMPSIGRRFVTWDSRSTPDEVILYDTQARAQVVAERRVYPDGYQRGWTRVAGDLLVFRRVTYDVDVNVPAQICWAMLPPPMLQ